MFASTKLKAIADDKFNVAKVMISVCDRVENVVGKGENAGYKHFLLFLQCIQKLPVSTLTQKTNLDSYKLKEFENDNFRFD